MAEQKNITPQRQTSSQEKPQGRLGQQAKRKPEPGVEGRDHRAATGAVTAGHEPAAKVEENDMNEIKFEGVCRHCTEQGRSEAEARVTGNGVSRPWRHDQRPANRHQAWPTGTLRQI